MHPLLKNILDPPLVFIWQEYWEALGKKDVS